MYENNVVKWRDCKEYLRELMLDASATEMEQLVLAYVAVQEKVEYWEEVYQPSLVLL